ncbi:SHOCT domain-containing protein [Halalkalicoccus tibetensis]|uniref:SHOCT domain-containing protein n=1 Tax=Halalkalicoccus tibetensis TaxID=175632 RepID=A0ABD5UZ08_9EURY
MDGEERDEWLMVALVLTLVIVLPLLILEAPWLLALAMLLGAGYWWQTGRNPVSATLDAVRGDEEPPASREPPAGARTADDDPLVVLRDRYARGEITEEEFERRLDRLLATEPDELDRERDRSYER